MTTPTFPPETTTEPPIVLNPSFKLVLKKGSQTGAQVAISVSVKVPSLPTYTVSPDTNYITVSQSVNFVVNSEFVPNGTELFWVITLHNVFPTDFTSVDMEGTTSIQNGVAGILLTLNDTISVPNSVSVPFDAYILIEIYSDEAKQNLIARSKKVLVYYFKQES